MAGERGIERENFHVLVNHQVAATAATGPGHSQKRRALCGSPTKMHFTPVLPLSHEHEQEVDSKVEPLLLQLVPTWYASDDLLCRVCPPFYNLERDMKLVC